MFDRNRHPFSFLLPSDKELERRRLAVALDPKWCRDEVRKRFPGADIHSGYPGLTQIIVRHPDRDWRGQITLGTAVSADDCWRWAYADHVMPRAPGMVEEPSSKGDGRGVRSVEQVEDGFPRWDDQGRRITEGAPLADSHTVRPPTAESGGKA